MRIGSWLVVLVACAGPAPLSPDVDGCPGGACPTDGCATTSDCGDGQTCCDNSCVDTTTDANSCGACGVACGAGEDCCDATCKAVDTLADCGTCGNSCTAGEFCDGTQCNAPVYPNFCANKKVFVIQDGVANDGQAADLMASTIAANCPPDVELFTAHQTDPALVDQATGRPLAGSGVTYVLGGGPFPNAVVRWLENTSQTTKIYFEAPDGVRYNWRERQTSAVVASMAASECSTFTDQFVIELVTDPTSGTLSLIGYGACNGGKGTLAAAWYYANVLLPNSASYPSSWSVFRWSDTNRDSLPDAGDSFAVLAQGL